jgi:hypothetical protein
VAEALPRNGETAALVAQRLRLAGDDSAAAGDNRLAGDHAAALLAHADALEHSRRPSPSALPTARASPRGIGDLRTLVGDYAGALASYERANADRRVGRSEARLTAGHDSAPAEAKGLRARNAGDLALTLHQTARSDEATARAAEALELSEAADDRRAQAGAQHARRARPRPGRSRARARSPSAASGGRRASR